MSTKASAKSVPIRRSIVPPERCSLFATGLRWGKCSIVPFEIVFVALQGLFMVYTSRVFLISSSVLEARVISMISHVSHLFSPPARFIVRWVAVPAIPSRSAAFLDSRLVFDPESIIASISTSVPPESITLTF